MTNDQTPLLYFISENHIYSPKGPVLIVSFIGAFRSGNSRIIEECFSQIMEKTAKWIILNFRDVPSGVDQNTAEAIARFKTFTQEKSVNLCFVALHPDNRKFLTSQGVIQAEDISNNLMDALRITSNEIQNAA